MTPAGAHDELADHGLCAVARLVELVSATTSVARALLQGERPIDLRGLESGIGLLCARILDLPPEQGRGFRSPLAALLDEVDALQTAMETP